MKLMKLLTALLCCIVAFAAETKVKLEDLPGPVRTSVQQQLNGAELVGLTKEKEKGKTSYEVETKRNGKTRDILLDASGAVTEVEEEIDLAAVPAAARAALDKRTAGATITKVEALSKGGTIFAYEAAIKKGTKTSEVAVTPEGKPFKD